MNGMNGSAIEGRVLFCACGTPPCASTRRTVEWCSISCLAIVPIGQLLGVMQPQHLGLHRPTDHPRRSAEAPTAPRAQPSERRQRCMAKIAPSSLALSLVVALRRQGG